MFFIEQCMIIRRSFDMNDCGKKLVSHYYSLWTFFCALDFVRFLIGVRSINQSDAYYNSATSTYWAFDDSRVCVQRAPAMNFANEN